MGFIPGKKKELMEIDDLYDSISSFSFIKKILKESVTSSSTDLSGMSVFKKKGKKLKNDKYFVIHHTAGRGTAKQVVDILNTRKCKDNVRTCPLGIQWIIDRDGKLFSGLPRGSEGAHICCNNKGMGNITNQTAQGVEIIASDDTDILIKQCKTALLLIKDLGYSLSNVYGHGEVSSNKMKDEGATCKAYVTKYWNTPESELPDVDTTLNTNVSDKKDTKDKKEDKPKENKSKEVPTQKNETFCKCLSDEKNKSSSTWVFKDAVKKCNPSTTIDAAIALAKLCKTNNTTTTGSNNNEKPKEKWSDKIKFSFSDMFKGVSLEEQKILKNIERIKKIL